MGPRHAKLPRLSCVPQLIVELLGPENHESNAIVAEGDSRVFYGTFIPAVSMMVAYVARSCFSAAS